MSNQRAMCDVCNKWPWTHIATVVGIETYICAKCFGDEPEVAGTSTQSYVLPGLKLLRDWLWKRELRALLDEKYRRHVAVRSMIQEWRAAENKSDG